MIHEIRRAVRGISRTVWLAILGVIICILIIFAIPVEGNPIDPAVLQLTLDAASTQANLQYPTLRTRLTETPIQAMMTQAAPTLALEGFTEVQQFAAAASADNSRGDVDWSPAQATGPNNTQTCGDARTAWASLNPKGQGTLTLLFAQLVIPTRVRVYESFNPGFIRHINIRDVYGQLHTVYTAEPAPGSVCPAALTVEIPKADYAANTVIILVDQTTSAGGWAEIDAVELIGTKYN